MLPVAGYGARLPLLNHFGFGSLFCFFITTLEIQNPRGWKAIGTRGSCSGSALNFWAPGGSVGAWPEASFVLPSIHIVEKISFCIIRISLKLLNSSVSLPWIRQSPQVTDVMKNLPQMGKVPRRGGWDDQCFPALVPEKLFCQAGIGLPPVAFGDIHP